MSIGPRMKANLQGATEAATSEIDGPGAFPYLPSGRVSTIAALHGEAKAVTPLPIQFCEYRLCLGFPIRIVHRVTSRI